MSLKGNFYGTERPNLHKRLFWDWRFDAIDWQKGYQGIIARVVERGTDEELDELIRFYGIDKVVNALEKEIVYLPDYAIDRAVNYFGIDREHLASYQRKFIRRGHWL